MLEAPKHAHFYRCFQALLLIFVFKQYNFFSLLQQEPELVDKFHFHSIIHSPLNPLRFCYPPLVQEFTRVAQLLNVVDCTPINRQNARFHSNTIQVGISKQNGIMGMNSNGSNKGKGNSSKRAMNRVNGNLNDSALFDCNDPFIPFDEYALKYSSSFILPIYSFYSPIDPPPPSSSSPSIPRSQSQPMAIVSSSSSSHQPKEEFTALSTSISSFPLLPRVLFIYSSSAFPRSC